MHVAHISDSSLSVVYKGQLSTYAESSRRDGDDCATMNKYSE
jgi:hypothetical protein